MLRLEPGQKQVVRLIKQQPPPAGEERAYRILLDEISTPHLDSQDKNHTVNFQMRYSLLLFVYGERAAPETPANRC
ncbi:fimbrial biogenesis chaperone [Sodalis glossinidius]|uniref:fimbrial biogenesis chaperone n=1 Tax=Sodalis glossinidius TaxID=63612 RepID=UPI001FB20D06|nr:fimbria/pilus periplasmic chaperone [Sodalis glossinidius]